MDNYKIELASYKNTESNVVAEWLMAGYTHKGGRFFLALYDEEGNCLNTKYLSDNTLNQLIIKCYVEEPEE